MGYVLAAAQQLGPHFARCSRSGRSQESGSRRKVDLTAVCGIKIKTFPLGWAYDSPLAAPKLHCLPYKPDGKSKMTIESSNKPKAFQEFEHQGWEVVSAGYEHHFTRLTSQAVSATLDAAKIEKGMRVLDVCTGPGMLAAAAVERGAQVTGLDFSNNVLELAKKNVPDAEFRDGDAQSLPFEEGSFDAVVCGFGIIHVPEPAMVLSEIRRVLIPYGHAAVSVWEAPNPTNGFGLLFGAIKAHGNLDVPLPHGPDFFQFSQEEKLTGALRETGFSEVEIQKIDQTWELGDSLGVFRGITEGAVRARGLLEAQTEAARQAISEAVIAGMSRYAASDGLYQVPMPALVGSGTK
jgi:2-polyprenyl-3-methyl-5-hydroxy-6-metoxy-1,4-benzoquinol methylase